MLFQNNLHECFKYLPYIPNSNKKFSLRFQFYGNNTNLNHHINQWVSSHSGYI